MARVAGAGDLAAAFATAARRAQAAFGTGELYVERYLERPRHVEVQVFGDASEMAINNYNKPGSNADVMIITVAPNPGSLQFSAIGRFPSDGSFADLDRALETLFARPPDRRGTDTQDTGEMTAQSFWNLEHNSVEALHFFGRNSVMIVVRFQ